MFNLNIYMEFCIRVSFFSAVNKIVINYFLNQDIYINAGLHSLISETYIKDEVYGMIFVNSNLNSQFFYSHIERVMKYFLRHDMYKHNYEIANFCGIS